MIKFYHKIRLCLSTNKLLIDDVEADEFVLRSGYTYVFDVDTSGKLLGDYGGLWFHENQYSTDQIIRGDGKKTYEVPAFLSLRVPERKANPIYLRDGVAVDAWLDAQINDSLNLGDTPYKFAPDKAGVTIDGILQQQGTDYSIDFESDLGATDGKDHLAFATAINGNAEIRYKHNLYNGGIEGQGISKGVITITVPPDYEARTIYANTTRYELTEGTKFVFKAKPENQAAPFVKDLLPDDLAATNPGLLTFLEHYFEYESSEGRPAELLRNLKEYTDSDRTTQYFFNRFRKEFMASMPEGILADERLLLKHITDFYKARGTDRSIEFLLRVMFGKESTVWHPKEFMLRASDGTWIQEKFLQVVDVETAVNEGRTDILGDLGDYAGDGFSTPETIVDLQGKAIRGVNSKATAVVTRVSQHDIDGVHITELVIENSIGEFTELERLEVYAGVESGGAPQNLDTYVVNTVKSLTIVDGGSGHKLGEKLTFTTADGIGLDAQVFATDANGAVTKVTINKSGRGYLQGETGVTTPILGGAEPASFTINTGTSFKQRGYWKNTDGALSGDHVLADDFFYQHFSYVVDSNVEYSKYKDRLKAMTHPSGLQPFGRFLMGSENRATFGAAGRGLEYNANNVTIRQERLAPANISLEVEGIVGAAPLIDSQSIDFGENTLEGAGAFTLTALGSPIENVVINSGDPNGHWNITNGGVITPTAAGEAASLGDGPYTLNVTFSNEFGSVTPTITIEIEDDTFSVVPDSTGSEAELTDALDAIAPSGGSTIRFRPGVHKMPSTGSAFDDRGFSFPTFFDSHGGSEDRTVFRTTETGFNTTQIQNPEYLFFTDLIFEAVNDPDYHTGSSVYGLEIVGDIRSLYFTDCIFRVTPTLEDVVDFSELHTKGAKFTLFRHDGEVVNDGIYFYGCEFSEAGTLLELGDTDVSEDSGIDAPATVVENCRFYNFHDECITYGTVNNLLIQYCDFSRRYCSDLNTNVGNFIRGRDTTTGVNGARIIMNRMTPIRETALPSTNYAVRGIYSPITNASTQNYNWDIFGNIIMTEHATGIEVQTTEDVITIGNVCVTNELFDTDISKTPTIAFPNPAGGTSQYNSVFLNIAASFSSDGDSGSGPSDRVSENQVADILTTGLATSYDSIFIGPTFSPTTIFDVMAVFELNPAGEAYASIPKIGNKGTEYFDYKGYAPIRLEDPYYDHPDINDASAVDSVNVTVPANALTVSDPILIDNVDDQLGNTSVNGVTMRISGAGPREYRITDDTVPTTVLVDWTDEANIIQQDQYLWLRNQAGPTGGDTVETYIDLGTAYFDAWTITTEIPVNASVTSSSSGGDNTVNSTLSYVFPPSVNQYDVVFMFIRTPDAEPTGSQSPFGKIGESSNGEVSVWAGFMSGSEGGTSGTINLDGPSKGSYVMFSVSDIDESFSIAFNDAGGDPPAANVGFGDESIVLAVTTTLRGDNDYTAAPTNYTGLEVAVSDTGASTDNTRIAGAYRTIHDDGDNPGTFTSTGTLDSEISVTLAIRSVPA